MFAKLFEAEIGQVLVKIDYGDEGPEVRFFFKPDGHGVSSVAITGFKDDEEGWESAEKYFETIDEDRAITIAREAIESIAGLLNKYGESQ